MNNDITSMPLFRDGNGGGGGGDIPEGYSYIKIGEEFNFRNVTLTKTPLRVRLENGEFVETYVIKPKKAFGNIPQSETAIKHHKGAMGGMKRND